MPQFVEADLVMPLLPRPNPSRREGARVPGASVPPTDDEPLRRVVAVGRDVVGLRGAALLERVDGLDGEGDTAPTRRLLGSRMMSSPSTAWSVVPTVNAPASRSTSLQ